jgi:outer membrane protein OmpA-like peptidoglycan-associated protein
MSDGQKTFWLSAGFLVVIALAAATLWQVTTRPTKDDLAALNAKVEQTNAKLAEVQKATATKTLAEGLTQLQDNIKGTNAALAKIQSTIAAGNVRERLDTLEKNMQAIDASLKSLQKAQATADLGGKVTALGAKVNSLANVTSQLGAKMANLSSVVSSVHDAMPKQNLADQIGPLNDKIKSLSATLGDIEKSTSLDGVKKQLAALNGKLESTNKAISGGGTDDTAALDSTLDKLKASLDQVAKLKAALKPPPKEAVVFYLHMPNEKNLPQKIASVQPLDIQFAKIGSTDDNGQAALIIPKLKTLIEGRKDCTISVAGFADTLGSDKLNLKISQQRAQNIAQKIKEAIPDVKVNVAAWGERRLQTWTPDATADENNRRVDISVNCKG